MDPLIAHQFRGGGPPSTPATPAPSDALYLLQCPSTADISLTYPSTSLICAVLCIISIILGVVVALKYNFLLLYVGRGDVIPSTAARAGVEWLGTRALHLTSTSNTYWILYLLQCGLRDLLHTLLYGISDINKSTHADAYLEFVVLGLHGVTALFFTLSLLYQYKHRSGSDSARIDEDTESTVTVKHCWTNYVVSWETGFVLLMVLHLVAAWWSIPNLPHKTFYSHEFWVYIGCLAAQCVPILILAGLIAFPPYEYKEECPKPRARLLLGLGVLAEIPHMLPPRLWNQYVFKNAEPCPLYIFSWYDITLLLHGVSLFCFFAFIRKEFKRVHEMEHYDCLQYYQDNLEYRGASDS